MRFYRIALQSFYSFAPLEQGIPDQQIARKLKVSQHEVQLVASIIFDEKTA